jgi:hypothetical protein
MRRLPDEQELEQLRRGLQNLGASAAAVGRIVNAAARTPKFTTSRERDWQDRQDRLEDLLTRN